MKIQGNPGHSVHAYGQIKRQPQAQAEQTNTAKPSDSVEAEASTQATSIDQLNIGEAKGVIRHLQEGHYQGVAQLRLSIVHAERFQQAASQATGEVDFPDEVVAWVAIFWRTLITFRLGS